jgi:hypothetical protein
MAGSPELLLAGPRPSAPEFISQNLPFQPIAGQDNFGLRVCGSLPNRMAITTSPPPAARRRRGESRPGSLLVAVDNAFDAFLQIEDVEVDQQSDLQV